MSEGTITLEKPTFSVDGSQSSFRTMSYKEMPGSGAALPFGGRENQKAQLSISNPRYREGRSSEVAENLNFVTKEYASKEEVLEIIRIYDVLRKEGFPVPPTTRYFKKNGNYYLAMTDMRRGGSIKVWGFNQYMTKEQAQELVSMELNAKDLSQIRDRVIELARKGMQKGIAIGGAHYHVEKDMETGKVDATILDATTKMDSSPTIDNLARANNFIQDLEERLGLKKQGDSLPRRIVSANDNFNSDL